MKSHPALLVFFLHLLCLNVYAGYTEDLDLVRNEITSLKAQIEGTESRIRIPEQYDILIKELPLKDAALPDVVEILRRKGVSLQFVITEKAKSKKVNLTLRNLRLSRVVNFVTQQSDLEWAYHNKKIYIGDTSEADPQHEIVEQLSKKKRLKLLWSQLGDAKEREEKLEQAIRLKEAKSDARYSLLLRAYEDGSREALKEFFHQWASNSEAIVDSARIKKPQWEQDAYSVFQDFYTPWNLQRVGKSEWGDKIYTDVDYLIIQNKIRVLVGGIDGSPSKENEYKIRDFRPKIEHSHAQALILDGRYRDILNAFLGDEPNSFYGENIMTPVHPKGESERRQKFLNEYIKVFRGHWGGWHLLTHPSVEAIHFDSVMQKAVVSFRILYQGGLASYEKQGGTWVLVNSQMTWIE